MDGSRTSDSIEGAIQRSQTVAPRFLGTRLHVGLVDLNDVRAGRKEILNFFIHCGGIVYREFFFILIEVVLSLLRHRIGAGDSDLDHSICITAKELDVAYFHRVPATNLS